MMPLDRNESYWLLDEELVSAVRAPEARELSTYPDYSELKAALAEYAGVAAENIAVTSGSVAAIEHIVRTYAGQGEEVLLPVPTFYCYETILESVGAKVVPVTYEEKDGQFIFPLAETITMLASGSVKVLFLCHPNNPLGCSLSREDVSAIAEAARASGTLVVSDEAYLEFAPAPIFPSFLPYLAELPNLILIRTLSKAFALSGTRVGYIIAPPKLVKEVEKIILPWTVAYPSVTAALALLARAEAVQVRRDAVIAEREHFITALRAAGIEAYPSETNFVLIRVRDAARVRDTLLAQGIRVALGEPMSHFPEAKELLKGTLRIAVPAPESETAFVQALQESLK